MKGKYSTFLALFFLSFFVSCKKDGVGSKKETVLYETDFSSDDGKWFKESNQYGTSSINNGYYSLISSATQGFYNTLNPIFNSNNLNVAVETSVKLTTNGATKYGNGGLVWGYRENSSGKRFNFQIAHNGYYVIYGYPNGDNDNYVDYVSWKLSSSVKQNQFNKLRIELREGTLYFFINSSEVYSMPAPDNEGLDNLGLVVQSSSTLQADYFKVVELR